MKSPFWSALFLAALVSGAAHAASIPRVKARIVSFDGKILVLDTDAAAVTPPTTATPGSRRITNNAPRAGGGTSPSAPRRATSQAAAAPGGKLTVALMPATLIVSQRPSVRQALRVGDFVGAVGTEQGGAITARDIYIYPDALRGANEGRFADGNEIRAGGTITALTDAGLTLRYRGLEAGAGGICMGRAVPAAVMPRACAGTITVRLESETPVTLLIAGDYRLLAAGAIATVSLTRTADGGLVTPGVIVEKTQSSP